MEEAIRPVVGGQIAAIARVDEPVLVTGRARAAKVRSFSTRSGFSSPSNVDLPTWRGPSSSTLRGVA